MSATETLLVSEVIPASRERIYAAWMDSHQHSAFTGETAEIDPQIGGRHSTFGGYASGANLELEPPRRIVQSWRSTEFPEGSPDSRLEVTLESAGGGTLVTVLHSEIPEGQSDRYRDGWVRYYLEPMKRYFSERVTNGVHHHIPAHVMADALEAAAEIGASEDAIVPQIRIPKSTVRARAETGATGDDLPADLPTVDPTEAPAASKRPRPAAQTRTRRTERSRAVVAKVADEVKAPAASPKATAAGRRAPATEPARRTLVAKKAAPRGAATAAPGKKMAKAAKRASKPARKPVVARAQGKPASAKAAKAKSKAAIAKTSKSRPAKRKVTKPVAAKAKSAKTTPPAKSKSRSAKAGVKASSRVSATKAKTRKS